MRDCHVSAILRSMIGLENSRHFFNQSAWKLKTTSHPDFVLAGIFAHKTLLIFLSSLIFRLVWKWCPLDICWLMLWPLLVNVTHNFFIPLVALKPFASFYACKNAQYAFCNKILFYQLSKWCKLATVKTFRAWTLRRSERANEEPEKGQRRANDALPKGWHSERRSVSMNSLRWPIFVINSVYKTKLPNFRLVLTPQN